MCQRAFSEEAIPTEVTEELPRSSRRCSGTGVYIPASILVSSKPCSPVVPQPTSHTSSPACSEYSTQRQDSGLSMSSTQTMAPSRVCPTGNSPTGRSAFTGGSSAPGRYIGSAGSYSNHSGPMPCFQSPDDPLGMATQQQRFPVSSTAQSNQLYAEYEAWLAVSQRQAYPAPRRHASVDLPAAMGHAGRPSSSSARRHSYHVGYHMSATHHGRSSIHIPTAAAGIADPSAAPYPRGRRSSGYGLCSPSSSSGYGHPTLMQQQVQLSGLSRASSCSTSGPLPALPDDYGTDEVLLDEHIQAMLLDVLQLSTEVAAGVARSNSGNSAQLARLQQQQQMQAADSLAVQDAYFAPLAAVSSGMLTSPTAVPILSSSYDTAACAGMTTPEVGSPLSNYMNRHEQQKARHQQCITAAAASAFYGPGNCSAGADHPLAAGLNERAQAKLQELMIAQQLQLEIQSELLQLLSAN